MRLLAYRQNALSLPMQRAFRRDNKRPNPYGAESQEDPYLNLIARFAIAFEQTYLHWLYEALEVVEARQKQAPGGEESLTHSPLPPRKKCKEQHTEEASPSQSRTCKEFYSWVR